jgi:hypothetical protein
VQERPSAGKRSLGLLKLRRRRLEDVPHFRRDVKLDGDIGGGSGRGKARGVIQQHASRRCHEVGIRMPVVDVGS